ncbi:MAG: protein kinase domain-containing protein, partial [Gemmataceae bacterium]
RDPQREEEALRRFRSEAAVLAQLPHPNIVQIYEIREEDGVPFLVMELCPGGSLADRLQEGPLGPNETALVVAPVAAALHAAHLANIIHRDIKPHNILFGREGQPKVADFGLARRLLDPSLTAVGAVLGTPQYMAPEQANPARTGEVGPLSDVWGLGTVLYECLTGRPPFQDPDFLEVLFAVQMVDPVAPRVLSPRLPADLETITLKCLHKIPSRRYASAADLADDLQRFLDGRPIKARPVGHFERAWRWTRRHPVLTGLVATLAVAVVSLVVAGFAIVQARASAALAALENLRAEEAEKAKHEIGKIALRAQYEVGIAQAAARLALGDVGAAEQELEKAAGPEGARPYIGFERGYLKRRTSLAESVITCPRGEPLAVAWSPDGMTFAYADTTGNVYLIEVAGSSRRQIEAHQGPVRSVSFSPDGRHLATAGDDAAVNIWAVSDGLRVARWPAAHEGGVVAVRFSPRDGWLASAGRDGQIHRWHVGQGKPVQSFTLPHRRALALAIHPRGSSLMASCPVIDPRSGAETGLVVLWDLGPGFARKDVPTLTPSAALSYLPGGDVVCFQGRDGLTTFDVARGQTRAEFSHPDGGRINAVAIHPDGDRCAFVGEKEVVALGKIGQADWTRLAGHGPGRVHDLAFSPNGTRLLSAGQDGQVRVWRADAARPYRVLDGHAKGTGVGAVAPDRRTLALLDPSGVVNLHDGQERRFLRRLCHPTHVRDMAFDAEGKRLATLGDVLQFWDVDSGRLVASGAGLPPGEPARLALSDDGRWTAFIGSGPHVHLSDRTKQNDLPFRIPFDAVPEGIAFAPG